MKRVFLLPLLVVLGCADAGYYRRPTAAEANTLMWENDLTLDQQTYILGLRSEPTTFDVAADGSNAAWARARQFVEQYSDMKIRVATDAEIRTDASVAPSGTAPASCDAGYLITRTPAPGGGAHVVIKTAVSARDWVPCEIGRRRNARMLSRYMRTGELPHPELIQK